MEAREFSDINKEESVGDDNPAYDNADMVKFSRDSSGKSGKSAQSDPPPYEVTAGAMIAASSDLDMDEEEKILEVLRKIVRDCTHQNPLQRPTAKEVLRMLEAVAPRGLVSDMKGDISDDDDDDIVKKNN